MTKGFEISRVNKIKKRAEQLAASLERFAECNEKVCGIEAAESVFVAAAKFIREQVEINDRLREGLRDALAWTKMDLQAIDDISPNEDMLQARIDVLNEAARHTKEF